jgi:HAD superfamily hydrolase (TIGR01490 family)
MTEPHHLALFDFDGTITRSDSFLHFLLRAFSVRELATLVPGALWPIAGWGLGAVAAKPAKEAITMRLFRGRTVEELERRGRNFADAHMARLLRPAAIERIGWHRARGDTIVIVTASFRYWIEPWCARQNIALLATQLEERDGRLTGRFDGENCNGEEKVRRIRERYDLARYSRVFAYGNSKGDRPMLEIAHERAYRPFE